MTQFMNSSLRRTNMYKTMIAALSMLALMYSAASAAPKHNGNNHRAVNHVGELRIPNGGASTARANMSVPTRDSWENRSVFYQGPTYIGRY
jgi:hypothetical protein